MNKNKIIYQHDNFLLRCTVSPQKDYIIFEIHRDNKFQLLFQSLVSSEEPKSIIKDRSPIYAIGFINSGDIMIYSCGNIQYFMDMKTLEVLENKVLHEYEVSHIATAIDTDRFVMSGEYCQIWDSKNKIPIWQLEGYRAVKEETVYKQNILIFEKNGWTIDFINDSYTHQPAIADISKDGKQIAVSGFNQPFVNIINVDTGELLQQLGPAPLQTTICKFSPNYKFLAVVGMHPNCTFIWNLKTGERHLPDVFDLELFGRYTALCFHPSKAIVAFSISTGYIFFFSLKSGDFLFSIDAHQRRRISNMEFLNENQILSVGHDGRILVTDINLL